MSHLRFVEAFIGFSADCAIVFLFLQVVQAEALIKRKNNGGYGQKANIKLRKVEVNPEPDEGYLDAAGDLCHM